MYACTHYTFSTQLFDTLQCVSEIDIIIKGTSTFSICTKHRGILLQTKERELLDWIYALDPLLAGTIK